MLPPIYFVIIGFFILIHGAFKPSSTITMFSSHVIIYLLYCFWGVPSLHEAFTSILFAAFMHWISLKPCLIYYVKMWIFYAFISGTCAAFLPYLIVRPFDEDNITRIKSFWKKTLPVFGISVEVRNKENLFVDGPCVIVSNHQSSLDILALVNVMPARTTALAKKEVKYMGPFGLAAWLSGLIFVDRSNHKSAISTMKYVASVIKERKVKIWIFPEGTRNMNGKLLPFKKGAFHLAIEAQVPIVSVVISSYEKFLNYDMPKFETGHVIVSCLPPFSTDGMKLEDTECLLKKIHQEMSRVFHEMSLEDRSDNANFA